LGGPSPPKFDGLKTSEFWQFRDLIADISGTQQDIISRKMALETAETRTQANLIRFTLVRKWQKIGPEF